MDIGTDRAKLHDLYKTLGAHWRDARDEWNDPVSKEFEETYWAELENRVVAAERAMETLSVLLLQARRDCS